VALPLGIAYFFVGPDAETIIYQAFSVSALVSIVVGIRRYRPAPSHHWWLFAGGLAMWCLGDAYWDCYRWILQTDAPYPSPADLAFFLGYPFLIAGLLTLARGWGRPRLGDNLDGLIIVVVAAILTGLFLLGPIFGAESSSPLAIVNALGIPIADVVLLAGLTQLILRGRVASFALRCITVALISTLAADPIYSYLSLKGTYSLGMPVDAGWLILYGLWRSRRTASVDGTDGVSSEDESGDALALAYRCSSHGPPRCAGRADRRDGARHAHRHVRAGRRCDPDNLARGHARRAAPA